MLFTSRLRNCPKMCLINNVHGYNSEKSVLHRISPPTFPGARVYPTMDFIFVLKFMTLIIFTYAPRTLTSYAPRKISAEYIVAVMSARPSVHPSSYLSNISLEIDHKCSSRQRP